VKFILTFGNQNLTKEGKWKGKLEPFQKDLASLRNNSLARDVQPLVTTMSPKRTTPAQISEASIAADEDYLSNWMARLPEKKKLAPLSQLAVPGTHDSFTYSLSKDFPVGPGQFFSRGFHRPSAHIYSLLYFGKQTRLR